MSDYVVKGESLTAVADAIRSKTGDSGLLEFPDDFVDEIDDLKIGYTVDEISEHDYGAIDLILTCRRAYPYAFFRTPIKSVTSTTLTHFTDHANSTTVGSSGAYVFARCTDLESVNLPNLQQPGSGGYQFAYCTKLTTIHLPSCTFVGQHMFDGCTALVTAVLERVTSTNNYGFTGCSSLETADFGDVSLSSIKSQEFQNCAKLTKLILRRSGAIVPLGSTNNFSGTPFASGKAGGTIYIPKVLYDHLGDGTSLDYKNATNWKTYDGYGTITWAKIEGSTYEHYWGDGTGINQTVTLTLTNCASSNEATAVPYGDEYTTTITADEGYTLSSVSVSMNGSDVTSSVYNSSTGVISIANVSGAIIITASATAS